MPLPLRWFIDGSVLFPGVILLIAGMLLATKFKKGAARSAYVVAMGLGLGLVWASAVPLGWIEWVLVLAVPFVARCEAWPKIGPRRAWMLRLCLALVLVAMAAPELARRREPHVDPAGRPMFVLADSLTAGVGDRTALWPEQLKRDYGITVTSFARAGARLHDGLGMAERLPPEPACVWVELGGNDLLGGATGAEFSRDMRALLDRLSGRGDTIVMFELPMHPLRRSFGAVQRSLAEEYDAILVPKTVLARVITSPGATSDGLHLSEHGQALLAGEVAGLLRR